MTAGNTPNGRAVSSPVSSRQNSTCSWSNPDRSYPVDSTSGSRSRNWPAKAFDPRMPIGPMMSGALPPAICVDRLSKAISLSTISTSSWISPSWLSLKASTTSRWAASCSGWSAGAESDVPPHDGLVSGRFPAAEHRLDGRWRRRRGGLGRGAISSAVSAVVPSAVVAWAVVPSAVVAPEASSSSSSPPHAAATSATAMAPAARRRNLVGRVVTFTVLLSCSADRTLV